LLRDYTGRVHRMPSEQDDIEGDFVAAVELGGAAQDVVVGIGLDPAVEEPIPRHKLVEQAGPAPAHPEYTESPQTTASFRAGSRVAPFNHSSLISNTTDPRRSTSTRFGRNFCVESSKQRRLIAASFGITDGDACRAYKAGGRTRAP
jgi:hypothetical protein